MGRGSRYRGFQSGRRHAAGSFGDFADLVVPELQRRGGCGATTKATLARKSLRPVKSASATIIRPHNIGGGDRRRQLRV
jgi:hypothetical protein